MKEWPEPDRPAHERADRGWRAVALRVEALVITTLMLASIVAGVSWLFR